MCGKGYALVGTHKLTKYDRKAVRARKKNKKQCKQRYGSPGGAPARCVNGEKQNKLGLEESKPNAGQLIF